MRALLEQITEDVLIVDQSSNVRFIAEKLRKKLGYTEEVIGMKAECLIRGKNLDASLITHNLYSQKSYPIQFVAKEGQRFVYKVQMFQEKWQGEYNWYILGSEVEEELKSEEDARCILEQLPVMIATKNLEGKYTYINKVAAEYLEYISEEILGKSDEELFGGDTGGFFQEMDRQVMQEEKSRFIENWIRTKYGRLRLLQVNKFPMYNDSKEVCGMIKVVKRKTVSKMVGLEQERKLDEILKMIDTGKAESGGLDFRITGPFSGEEILRELKAEGFAIWMYDESKESLECKLALKTHEELKRDDVGNRIIGQSISLKNKKDIYEGIKAIEEIDWNWFKGLEVRKRIEKQGIQFIGVFTINYENEFLGIVNFLYKDYTPLDGDKESTARKVARTLAESIRQQKLSHQFAQELRKQNEIEEELRYLLDTTSDRLWNSSGEEGMLKVSQETCKLLGRSEAEIMKNTIMSYVYEEDRHLIYYIKELTKKNPGKIYRFILRLVHVSGDIVWVEGGGKYIADKQIYMCTSRDVTRKYRLKEQEKIYHRKNQLDVLKNEFLSNVSHEFKVSLSNLLAIEEQISKQFSKRDFQKYNEYLKRNIYRLMRLVNNLTDITHMMAGGYKIYKENCDIVQVVKEISSVAAKYAGYKGIIVSFETDIKEKIVGCDPDKIERIMLNLLSNAIKYTSKDGRIDVQLRVVEDKVRIVIEDNGAGIPKENLESVFEPFIQVDHSLTRHNEGSGIGLSIAKLLVELHQGSIYAESILGKGTKMHVELPNEVVVQEKLQPDRERLKTFRWERCRIEFSDIYDLY